MELDVHTCIKLATMLLCICISRRSANPLHLSTFEYGRHIFNALKNCRYPICTSERNNIFNNTRQLFLDFECVWHRDGYQMALVFENYFPKV